MIRLFLVLSTFALAAHGAVINFGSISYSDNNGGAFLNGSSAVRASNTLDIKLPSFSQSNFDVPSPGEVDFAFTVTSTNAILSINYVFSGAFTGAGVGRVHPNHEFVLR